MTNLWLQHNTNLWLQHTEQFVAEHNDQFVVKHVWTRRHLEELLRARKQE